MLGHLNVIFPYTSLAECFFYVIGAECVFCAVRTLTLNINQVRLNSLF